MLIVVFCDISTTLRFVPIVQNTYKLDPTKSHRQSCTTMLVYGLRCSASELLSLPKEIPPIEYHVEHGILVFPSYTKPTVISTNGSATFSDQFIEELKAIARGRAWVFQREHPYITEDEDAIVSALKNANPLITTEWFYIPPV